jgi:hypothetical protein
MRRNLKTSAKDDQEITIYQPSLQHLATFEALRGPLRNLEETIASLLELMKSIPEGELREKLFLEISALD